MAKSRKLDLTKTRENKKQRSVSFTKRRHGLFNKAAELYMLCNSQLALLVSSPSSNKIYSFGHPSVDVLLDAFLENRVPNGVNNMEKQYLFSLMTEISSLEDEISTCTQRKEKSEDLATGFSWIFEFFESLESIEELKVVVGALGKLIDKANSRAGNFNSISCVTSHGMGYGNLESFQFVDDSSLGLLIADGLYTFDQTDYASCAHTNDISPTTKADNTDILTLQTNAAFGYNYDSSIPVENNGNSMLDLPESTSLNNFNELIKGKHVDCSTASNYSRQDDSWSLSNYSAYSLLDDVFAMRWDNESSPDFGAFGSLDNDCQNFRGATD